MPMAKIVQSVVQDYCDMVQMSAKRSTCRKTCPITTLPRTNTVLNDLFFMLHLIKFQNKNAYGCNFSCRWLSPLCWPTRTDTPAWCPAFSSMIGTRVHLMMAVTTFCLQLSTLTELVVMVGCVSIAGDRSSTWWSSGTLWQGLNTIAILWFFTNVGTLRELLFVWTLFEADIGDGDLQEYGGNIEKLLRFL